MRDFQWEGDDEREMWPVEARAKAKADDWEIIPTGWSDRYVMGWISFRARGETLIEYIASHMEAGTDPDLYDRAWLFYTWLVLQNRVEFKLHARQ